MSKNKVKVLITGSEGMLGSSLKQIFSCQDLVAMDKDELDVTNRDDVMASVDKIKPHIIINAAAYTNVDKAESEKELADDLNGNAVGYLAEAAKNNNAVLIHFSTDYIFNGSKKDGYKEDYDNFESLNAYGSSKLKGEEFLRKNTQNFYLIRTSWLFGTKGKNFVKTMLDLAYKGKDPIKVVNDQVGKPTYAWDLAKGVYFMLAERKPFGIYHMTNEGVTSWYEFARDIFKEYNKYNPSFDIPRIQAIGSDEFETAAKRPSYSILLNTKNMPFRHYSSALNDYFHYYTPPVK